MLHVLLCIVWCCSSLACFCICSYRLGLSEDEWLVATTRYSLSSKLNHGMVGLIIHTAPGIVSSVCASQVRLSQDSSAGT